jgi:hypothetical protein
MTKSKTDSPLTCRPMVEAFGHHSRVVCRQPSDQGAIEEPAQHEHGLRPGREREAPGPGADRLAALLEQAGEEHPADHTTP